MLELFGLGHHTKSWSKHSSKSSFGRPRDKDNHNDDSDDSDEDLVPTPPTKGSIRWTDKPEGKIRRHKLLPSFTNKNLRPVTEVRLSTKHLTRMYNSFLLFKKLFL